MNAFTITLYIIGIALNVYAATHFRWNTTPTARDRIEAAARGLVIVSSHRPALTKLVRFLTATAAVYLTVSGVLTLAELLVP